MTSATENVKVIHVDSFGVPIGETMELIKALWMSDGISPKRSTQPLIELIERLIIERKAEVER